MMRGVAAALMLSAIGLAASAADMEVTRPVDDRATALLKGRYVQALSLKDDEVERFLPHRFVMGARLFMRQKGANANIWRDQERITPTIHEWGLGSVSYRNGLLQHGSDEHPAGLRVKDSGGKWSGPPEKPLRETWSPAGYRAEWAAPDGLLLSEEVSVLDDVLTNVVRISNPGDSPRKAALAVTGTIRQRGDYSRADREWEVSWNAVSGVLRAREDRLREKLLYPEAAVNSTRLLAVRGDFAVDAPVFAPSPELIEAGKGVREFGPHALGEHSEWAYRFTATAEIPPGQAKTVVLAYTRYPRADLAEEAMARVLKAPQKAYALAEKEWNRYFDKTCPRFRSDDPDYVSLYYWNCYGDRANRVEFIDYPTIRRPIVVDDRIRYVNFQATGCYGRRLQMERWLRDETCLNGLEVLLSSQRKDGNCGIPVDDPAAEGGMFTEMPILTAAAWAYFETTWDLGFLRRALPVLISYDGFFRDHRDADGDGLIDVLGMGEIGTYDDSPRCYEMGATGWFDWTFDNQPAEPVDVNSVIYLQRKLIARMAGLLGQGNTRREFEKRAGTLKRAMDRVMWDSARGLYCDVYGPNHERVRAKTPAIFVPLRAGLAAPGRANQVIREHMLNPQEFWSERPIPSLSYDDKHYSAETLPACSSRGEISIDLAWDAVTALALYGEEDKAAEVTDLMVRMMVKEGRPTSGERYAPSGRPIGGCTYGWSDLINDVVITRVLGIRPDPEKREVVFAPRLPESMGRFSFSGVKIGGGELGLSCRKTRDSIELMVSNTGTKPIRIRIGDCSTELAAGRRISRRLTGRSPVGGTASQSPAS